MVSFLMAVKAEHSVPLWHPVFTYLSGTNTVSKLPEPIRVSTPNTAKQIHPFTARDCYSFTTLSKRFIAVCAGNIHVT
jgi:hypothetical protein